MAASNDTMRQTLWGEGPSAHSQEFFPAASRLMHHVITANYKEIEKMVDEDVGLMFQTVELENADDGTKKCISPLQKAFEEWNTYAWLIFYSKIENQIALADQFYAQEAQQTSHIDLEPLFDAYCDWNTQYKLWTEKKISDKEIDA